MRRIRDAVDAMQTGKAAEKLQRQAKKWVARQRAAKKMQAGVRGRLVRRGRGGQRAAPSAPTDMASAPAAELAPAPSAAEAIEAAAAEVAEAPASEI